MQNVSVNQSKAVIAAAAMAVFGAGLPALGANLLINPSFEGPPDSGTTTYTIGGWTLVNDAMRAAFAVANNTPGGRWGLWAKTFQPIGGGAQQDVTIVPGAEYAFSSFINYETNFLSIEDPVSLRMQVTWLDAGNNEVGTRSTLDLTPLTAPQPALEWRQFSLNTTAPATAAKARVFVGWDGGGIFGGPQSGFFDDVVFDGPGTPPPPNQWLLNSSGDWNIAGNWSDNQVPDAVGIEANLAAIITSAQTIYANSPVTVGTLNFNNANTYVVAGAGSMTLQASSGNAVIAVAQGTHKVNLPIFLGSNAVTNVAAGATLFMSDPIQLNGRTFTTGGAGTTLIEAPVRSSSPGKVSVSGGTTQVNFGIGEAATASLAAVANTTLEVTGGKATINANQTLRGIDVVTANAGDQELDIRSSVLRVYPANRAAEEASILADIKSAVLSGSGRDGIYSSNDPGANFAVGVTDQATDANGGLHVLVRLTRTGDANVNGTVNLDDFTALAAGFGVGTTWDQGDFNYDGAVNLDDFTALAANFGTSAADVARSSVPEPTALSLLALGAGVLARRRR